MRIFHRLPRTLGPRVMLAILTTAVMLLVVQPTRASEVESLASRMSIEFDRIADTVLEHHLVPPAKQQMLLVGLRGIYAATGKREPSDLARRVSAAADGQSTRELITEELAELQLEKSSHESLLNVFRQSLLQASGPSARWMNAEERRVDEQLQNNLYVGIGIALSLTDNIPVMAKVFPGGPAAKAGARAGDRILVVDGKKMSGLSLAEVVQHLRGVRGSSVELQLQHPRDAESRELKMVRDVVPFETVEGRRRADGGGWEYELEDAPGVAYLRIASIKGSTVSEFRAALRSLKQSGVRALLVDLRNVEGGTLRHSSMLADVLLDQGHKLGTVARRGGQKTHLATTPAEAQDWPVAILVGGATSPAAEWLIAAWSSSDRIVAVGQPVSSRRLVAEWFSVSDGAVQLPVGRLIPNAVKGHDKDGQTAAYSREPAGPPMERRLLDLNRAPQTRPEKTASTEGALAVARELILAALAKRDAKPTEGSSKTATP